MLLMETSRGKILKCGGRMLQKSTRDRRAWSDVEAMRNVADEDKSAD